MSTRSQKRGNNHQERSENVSECLVFPVFLENANATEHDVVVTGPSRAKSHRVENSVLESSRVSLKERNQRPLDGIPEIHVEIIETYMQKHERRRRKCIRRQS